MKLSLPQELLISIVQELEKDDWKKLVLVSKDFRYAARRFIWKELKIYSIDKFDFVLALFQEDLTCGRNVRKLDIIFRQDEGNEKRLSFIPRERFIQLVRLLPGLRELIVRDADHIQFTPNEIEKYGYRSLFPCLTTFRFGEINYHGQADVDSFASFLTITPSITSLEYYLGLDGSWGYNDDFEPISVSSHLKSIKSGGIDFFLDSGTTILPQTSWTGLEKLVMEGDNFYTDQLFDLIRKCSSTLLCVQTDDDYEMDYLQLKPLFPLLKKIEVLNINVCDPPLDILMQIPTTVKSFGTHLWQRHLSWLYLHPRPLLKLLEIHVEKWEDGLIQFLPESVTKITIQYLEEEEGDEDDFVYLVDEILNYDPANLKEINVFRFPSRADSCDEEKADLTAALSALGIKLEVQLWQ